MDGSVKVTHVRYERLHSFGNYCNEKYDLQAEVVEGQDPEGVMRSLRRLAQSQIDEREREEIEAREREIEKGRLAELEKWRKSAAGGFRGVTDYDLRVHAPAELRSEAKAELHRRLLAKWEKYDLSGLAFDTLMDAPPEFQERAKAEIEKRRSLNPDAIKSLEEMYHDNRRWEPSDEESDEQPF